METIESLNLPEWGMLPSWTISHWMTHQPKLYQALSQKEQVPLKAEEKAQQVRETAEALHREGYPPLQALHQAFRIVVIGEMD